MVTPAAHDIKTLQRKTGRVHFGVAGGARWVDAMFFELLAIVTAPRISGSMAGIFGGGGGVSMPRIRSVIQWPRMTGEVVGTVGGDFKTLAWVNNPPRRQSAGRVTRRMRRR